MTSTLVIVAHEDDDLLFCSPDVLHAVQSGSSVQAIYLTAGDGGQSITYWQGRENGSKAAYANMAGVANSWTQADAGVAGHPMPKWTLTAAPQISLIFMRLPDGGGGGGGFVTTGNVSLQQLYQGTISSITAVNGTSSYTWAQLVATLATLMTSFAPGQVLSLDRCGAYGSADHSDHHTTGKAAYAAALSAKPPILACYYGYETQYFPASVAGADLTGKTNAWNAYVPFDTNNPPGTWLPYQYQVARTASFPPSGISLGQWASAGTSANVLALAFSEATSSGDTLILVGRCYTPGGADALPQALTDSAGNTWHFSPVIAQNPPSDTQKPGSHGGAFVAWALAGNPASSATVTLPSGTGFLECVLTSWSNIASETTGGTVENNAAAAEVVSPALALAAGDLAVGIAYPASGASPLGVVPSGATVLYLGSDASNWAVCQLAAAGGTLGWDWGVATASVQAAAAFAAVITTGPPPPPGPGTLTATTAAAGALTAGTGGTATLTTSDIRAGGPR